MMQSYRWLTSVIALLASLSVAGTALAKEGFYASLAGAYALPSDSELSEAAGWTTLELKNGFAFQGAVGYGWPGGLRIEAELGWRRFETDRFSGLVIPDLYPPDSISIDDVSLDGSLNSLSLMANGVLSFAVDVVQPYLGVGLGVARHSLTWDETTISIAGVQLPFEGLSDDDVVLAFQAMLGVGYPISDHAEIHVGYRYFGTRDFHIDDVESTYGTHSVEAGVLFRF